MFYLVKVQAENAGICLGKTGPKKRGETRDRDRERKEKDT